MNQTTLGVHDPTIIFDDNEEMYYMFSTDTEMFGKLSTGIQIRSSKDLKKWDYLGTAFDGIPSSVYEFTNPSNLWAPEVIKMGDIYRMYYSASVFGTNKSCINLAEANHLAGPWIDRGLVISTHPDKDEQNAIDANVLFDHEGNLWMVYGSFFSGMYCVSLNTKTGKRHYIDDIGTCIAKRSLNVEGALEGPFVYYNADQKMYYLFVSYDFLQDTYNIRVARSNSITGPYYDYKGQSMMGDVLYPHDQGTKILGSYQIQPEVHWTAIGHNSILDTGSEQYLVAHSRVENKHAPHFAYIRKIYWLESGWPVTMIRDSDEILDLDANGKLFRMIEMDERNNLTVLEFERTIKSSDSYVVYSMTLSSGVKAIGISGISIEGNVFMGILKES